jgi:hypothetical protein
VLILTKCTDLVIHARKILMNLLKEFDIGAVLLDSYTFVQTFVVKTF